MAIERIQPLNQPSLLPNVNPASEERKVVSQETGLPVVARKEETAETSNNTKNQEMSRRETEKLAERLNRIMGLIDKRLQFRVHEQSGEVQVKVIDQENGEVLDEIPPTRLLDLMSSFRDITGILFDRKA